MQNFCVDSFFSNGEGNIMQGVLEQHLTIDGLKTRSESVFGKKIGLFTSLFGCWHKRLGRPMTLARESYMACVECGARKRFDAKNLTTYGGYYYPPKAAIK